MAHDDQLRAALAESAGGFAAVVSRLDTADLARPSPCDGWTVRDVIDHVVAGERFTAGLMSGRPFAEVVDGLRGLDDEDPDLVGQLEQASAQALASLDGPLDRWIDHRVGRITGRRNLGFRIIDLLGHTWDVAIGVSAEPVLDPTALAIGVELARRELPTLQASENFAPWDGDLPEHGADLDVLLAAIGRRV